VIHALGDREPVFEGTGHFIADNATVVGRVRFGTEVSVWFGAVIRGDNDDIDIGARSNIQDGCVLHVDPGKPLTIGEGVTVGHKVMLHGCSIGDNALIGIGSTILNGAQIGANSIVGAKSLVTENKVYPPGSLILGAPARVARELRAEEVESISTSAAHYVANAARYRAQLEAPG
jgi:carbonic anhydrase/acetyltransferase-like protein (isoleucine patch superfamily)